MSDFQLIEKKTLESLLNCFTDTEDLKDFLTDLIIMVGNLNDIQAASYKVEEYKDDMTILVASILLEVSVFCRNNYDLIRDLASKVNVKEITREEKDEYIAQGNFDMSQYIRDLIVGE